MVVGGDDPSSVIGHHRYACVSVVQPPLGQVGDVPVGGDILNGGGHCLVLSIPGWWLVLPADVSIMLSRAPWVNPT